MYHPIYHYMKETDRNIASCVLAFLLTFFYLFNNVICRQKEFFDIYYSPLIFELLREIDKLQM